MNTPYRNINIVMDVTTESSNILIFKSIKSGKFYEHKGGRSSIGHGVIMSSMVLPIFLESDDDNAKRVIGARRHPYK
jgi:hypothetical protein